jgi:hypothetical protein
MREYHKMEFDKLEEIARLTRGQDLLMKEGEPPKRHLKAERKRRVRVRKSLIK